MTNKRIRNLVCIATLLVLVVVLVIVGVVVHNKKQPASTGVDSMSSEVPTETEQHDHVFKDGKCQCGQTNGFENLVLKADDGSASREDDETTMTITSSHEAGEAESICLTYQAKAVVGQYFEQTYVFKSDVEGVVRFTSEDVIFGDTNEYKIVAGENKLSVRFVAKNVTDGVVNVHMGLGALGKFKLTFSKANCVKVNANFTGVFLDVAPEKASGSMETTSDGLKIKFKTEEGWRVKLASDHTFKKGKLYEVTYIFTVKDYKPGNVTYTVYDGAATSIGEKNYWVDGDVCIAKFYVEAKKNVTKGTCLELGAISGGNEVEMLVTYMDFKEVDDAKAEQLHAQNPFNGVNAWTEAGLTPVKSSQSADGLKLVNTNEATDWWKVKLEQQLECTANHYYRAKFAFNSDVTGKIKFVNDEATYYGSNEYRVRKGENVFTVEFKSNGNPYSCLELGGLGSFEMLFTSIAIEEIDEPVAPKEPEKVDVTTQSFDDFNVWKEESMQAISVDYTDASMTLVSTNAATDWWKYKLEKDIAGKTGKTYEVVYYFTSDTTGRIKFVNDDAKYFGTNEYDVVAGTNEFKVVFKYAGKPYSCLELGGLGKSKLTFTKYTIREVEEPVVVENGMEEYRAWTDSSLAALIRKDSAKLMTLISKNNATDWWKMKLEKDLDVTKGHYYEITYKFDSNVTGPIKFVCDGASYLTANEYQVVAGSNTFTVQFMAGDSKYSCVELGGLGKFELGFKSISFKEISKPVIPEKHEHAYIGGQCICGETNGFEIVHTHTEAGVSPITRVDDANSMTISSTNASRDWWHVKLENDYTLVAGKTYEATYKFTSNVSGKMKFGTNANVTCATPDIYDVVEGANEFVVKFTVANDPYICLELGDLGQFKLKFTEITIKEVKAEEPEKPEDPEEPEEPEKTVVPFKEIKPWTEGNLSPATKEDIEGGMILRSTNAAGDWWKVKLETILSDEVKEGKKYEVTFKFDSNASGRIKYSVDGATFLNANEIDVVEGSNTFTIQFTAGSSKYACLELGGLGEFELNFSEITCVEMADPEESNNPVIPFAEIKAWVEEHLLPVSKEDSEEGMLLKSANEAGDWWKVKLETILSDEVMEGKKYEVTFKFDSNASGRIKYSVDGATFLNANEIDAVEGSNTFTMQFTAGSSKYACLELGGLGNFELNFTDIHMTEITE